jgi:hypothetical protein
VFHGGCSWLTAVRQFGNVPVAISKYFIQYCTLLALIQVSPDMKQLMKDVCSKIVLLYEEVNHSMLVNDTSFTVK